MQVKKFEAPTIQEALDSVKRELGPEAVILQTKKYKTGFGLMSKSSVEITAAVSERAMQKKQYVEKRLPEETRQAAQQLSAARQAELYERAAEKGSAKATFYSRPEKMAEKAAAKPVVKAPAKPVTTTRYIDIEDETPTRAPAPKAPLRPPGMSLEEEVRQLKRMLEEVKGAATVPAPAAGQPALGAGSLSTPALEGVFEQLVINGVEKRHALALVRKAGFELGSDESKNPDAVLDQIASEIMGSTQVASALSGIEPGRPEGPTVLALVGPTGVGKTTTVAKLASEGLLRRGLKVGLINLDSYKVAAFDQLGTYAKILNVPFRSAASIEDLKSAFADFKSLDLILIDTTGRSPRDPESLQEMRAMLSHAGSLRCQLVLSATTRDAELYDMAQRFSLFRPEGIIVSKLDEATLYGAIYNVSQRMKLPLTYFTTGQRVPEDIEEATRERVASLILEL